MWHAFIAEHGLWAVDDSPSKCSGARRVAAGRDEGRQLERRESQIAAIAPLSRQSDVVREAVCDVIAAILTVDS